MLMKKYLCFSLFFVSHRLFAALSFLFLVIILLPLSACTNPSPSPTTTSPTIPLNDCILTASGSDTQIDAQCGTLTVYENPATQTGRQIDLHLAVLPAISRSPAPDPLFFLAGGPGQAATESFMLLRRAFLDINRERDIVLVDQRGTGKSHPLRCEFPIDGEAEDSAAQLAPQLESCLTQLDADPTLYTTAIAMQDLDQVRVALGYEQINLYGVSYGTRAALTYLHMYPTHVRTLILDGVVPQQLALGLDVAADAQHALDLIFARCADDPICAEHFPDLPTRFDEILTMLDAAPVPVRVADPLSGEWRTLDFTREMFAVIIRFYSYSSETVALIPLLISTAQEDYTRLAAQYLILTTDLNASMNNAMGYSVQCAEDMPFFTDKQATQVAQSTYLGAMVSSGLLEICKTWPVGSIPADFKTPVQADVPVLMLSGEYDPVTPPKYAELAAQTLPNSLQLVAPGQGHNIIARGCLPDIVEQFIDNGTIQGLDTACVNDIEPSPFFINFSGPMP
ncbi:MAG: alpha/beta fold hydrolase [Anaerolineales bacterium]|nr:alpha/beta fold hydrolase [Anaerolineales bacterium]